MTSHDLHAAKRHFRLEQEKHKVNIDKIIAYENGDLSDEDTIVLFQELVTSGDAWRLQGSYGRTAAALIDAGLVDLGGEG